MGKFLTCFVKLMFEVKNQFGTELCLEPPLGAEASYLKPKSSSFISDS